MTKNKDVSEDDETSRRGPAVGKLMPQARRALEEAAARRAAQEPIVRPATGTKKEVGGRDGPEPIRYGDWEVNGRASDF
jgi:hypothetical protein